MNGRLDGRNYRISGNGESPPLVQDVGVDQRRVHVLVAGKFLYGPGVVPVLEEMVRERMPECVAGNRFADACPVRRVLYGPLDHRFVEVVPEEMARIEIGELAARGEDPLPAP